ncbi:hypothetical protein BKA69DRAFT_1054610 [Paraphysoderma sedebokerense]|nr:hypothetical protein BKA69DRAFT_1054610 [Paraphysoderma sedebokerense]
MQEIMNYNPFGKGGAGAPLRASDGSVITNRSIAKQMALSPSQLPPILNFQQNQQQLLQQHLLTHSQAAEPTMSSLASDGNNSSVQPAILPPNLLNAGLIPGLQGLSLNPNLQLNRSIMNPHGILQLPVDTAPAQSLQLPQVLNHAIVQGQASIVSNPTTNNTPGRDKTTFLRGITDINNLPPWQRDEIIRKQNEQHAIQEALKQQMIEKEKAKAEAAARRKLEDQLEMERLKKEQEMLKLKYEKELEAQRKKDEEAKAANLASTVDRETKIKEQQKKQEDLYLIAKAEAEALKRKGRRRRAGKDEDKDSESHQEPYQPPSQRHPVALRPPSAPIPALRNQIGQSRINNTSELDINSRQLYDSANEPRIQSTSPPIPTLTKSRNSQSAEQLNEYSIPEIPPRHSRTSILLPPQVYPSPHGRPQNHHIQFAPQIASGASYSGNPQHPANSLSSTAAPSRSRPTTTKWSARPSEISQPWTQQSDNFQQSTQSVLAQLQALKRDLEIEQKNVEMSLAQPISVSSVSSTARSRGMNERLPKIEKGIVSTDRQVAAINVEEKRPGSMSARNRYVRYSVFDAVFSE